MVENLTVVIDEGFQARSCVSVKVRVCEAVIQIVKAGYELCVFTF